MIELLAPGGSMEGMKAAVHAGADAIYMGGQRFGARAYADNPQESQLMEAIDYCHLHGRKLYLTVNTLLKEEELNSQLYDWLLPVYEQGVDAVLVQDPGVFRFLRREFPDLPLHASTQMNITGPDGAGLLKSIGAERIVPARELSLSEIRSIHEQVDIEIESFVHGALCYCYSGQCLMSSMIGGRSGNRGRCAQPCRLPYELYRGSSPVSSPGSPYLLSLKDICTLRTIPEMAESGICSFKIEGRMKRPEYASGVVEIYRKYLDRYQANGKRGYQVDPADEKRLMDLYNRGGFSEGYYHVYNSKDMMAMSRPNHCGTEAARVLEIQKGRVRLKALEELYKKDALEIPGKTPQERRELVLREDVAAGKEFWQDGCYRFLQKNQVLPRVRCEKMIAELQERYAVGKWKEKIKGKFILKAGKSAILSLKRQDLLIITEGEMPGPAEKLPVDEETVHRRLSKTGNTPFEFEKLDIDLEPGLFYPMQQLNELRRTALEQLEREVTGQYRRNIPGKHDTGAVQVYPIPSGQETDGKYVDTEQDLVLTASIEQYEQLQPVLDEPGISEVMLDCCMFLEPDRQVLKELSPGKAFELVAERVHEAGKNCILMLPVIWREKGKRAFETVFSESVLRLCDGILIRTNDELQYAKTLPDHLIRLSDCSVYSYNREAREFLREHGITRDTVPVECNLRELHRRGCKGSEMIIYGYQPLMVTAQCLVKNTVGCRRHPEVCRLRDRKRAEFPVRNQCGICTNIIYNSLPLDLISMSREIRDLSAAACRMAFTIEDPEETAEVIRMTAAAFLENTPVSDTGIGGTRGHFKRGVE